MTISANYPSIRPSLLLDFANGKALDPRITFSRPTTARYYDANTSAIAEQNLLLQSQTFSNAAWVKQNSAGSTIPTITGSATDPAGGSTASTIAFGAVTGASDFSQMFQRVTIAAGTYTQSVYLKATAAGDVGKILYVYTQQGGTFTLTPITLTAVYQRVTIQATWAAGSIDFILTTIGTTFGGQTTTAFSVDVWGAQLEQRNAVTAYTLTTTAPVTNYIPVLLSAASNVPRFDHNPTTRESLGLLIEEQRTNILTYSEDFSNGAWLDNDFTVLPNLAISPDGTQNADQLVEDTGTIQPAIFYNLGISLTSGTAYTGSVYLKANGRSIVALYYQTANFPNSGRTGWFDLSNQTTQFESGVTGTITLVGNGWYRCSITATADATGSSGPNTIGILITPTLGSFPTYTGNGYSGIFIWGAQMEAGASPTSYIKTVASQEIRSADAASMTGTNFSSWFNLQQGTLYTEAWSPYSSGAMWGIPVSIDDGIFGYANIYLIRSQANNLVIANGVSSANLGIAGQSPYKSAITAQAGSVAGSINGNIVTSSTPTSVPSGVNRLSIGNTYGGNYLSGTIKKIAYYPLRVTNAQLQALTGS